MEQYEEKPVASLQLMQYFSKLGDEWRNIGAYEQAEDYYRRALKISIRYYGSSHKVTQDLSVKVCGLVMRQPA